MKKSVLFIITAVALAIGSLAWAQTDPSNWYVVSDAADGGSTRLNVAGGWNPAVLPPFAVYPEFYDPEDPANPSPGSTTVPHPNYGDPNFAAPNDIVAVWRNAVNRTKTSSGIPMYLHGMRFESGSTTQTVNAGEFHVGSGGVTINSGNVTIGTNFRIRETQTWNIPKESKFTVGQVVVSGISGEGKTLTLTGGGTFEMTHNSTMFEYLTNVNFGDGMLILFSRSSGTINLMSNITFLGDIYTDIVTPGLTFQIGTINTTTTTSTTVTFADKPGGSANVAWLAERHDISFGTGGAGQVVGNKVEFRNRGYNPETLYNTNNTADFSYVTLGAGGGGTGKTILIKNLTIGSGVLLHSGNENNTSNLNHRGWRGDIALTVEKNGLFPVNSVTGYNSFSNTVTGAKTVGSLSGEGLVTGRFGGAVGGTGAHSSFYIDGTKIAETPAIYVNGTTTTFAGELSDGYKWDANPEPGEDPIWTRYGTLNLDKRGATTQILSGKNQYIGTTSVCGGTLQIDGDNSLCTGAVTVYTAGANVNGSTTNVTGGTLGGSGTVGGATTVQNNATLNEGLEFLNRLTLGNGSILDIRESRRMTHMADGSELSTNFGANSFTIKLGGDASDWEIDPDGLEPGAPIHEYVTVFTYEEGAGLDLPDAEKVLFAGANAGFAEVVAALEGVGLAIDESGPVKRVYIPGLVNENNWPWLEVAPAGVEEKRVKLDRFEGSVGNVDFESNVFWTATLTEGAANFDILVGTERTVEGTKNIVATTQKGRNDGPVKIIAKGANASTAPKLGKVRISYYDWVEKATFYEDVIIEQIGISLSLPVESRSALLAGEEFEVAVEANVEWEVAEVTYVSGGEDWIEIDEETAQGDGNGKFKVTAGEGTIREATITVRGVGDGAGLTAVFTVTQEAPFLRLVDLASPASMEALASGEGFTVALASNVSWTVASNDASWLHVESPASGSGSGNADIVVKADPFTDPGTRNANVRIRCTNTAYGLTSQVVTFTQNEAVLEFNAEGVSAPPTRSTLPVSLTSNIAWVATSSESWMPLISPADGNGAGTATINVDVRANTTNIERSGTLTVAAKDAAFAHLDDEFTITQAPETPSLTVTTPKSFAPNYEANAALTIGIDANISWTVSSNATDWLTVTSSPSGAPGTGLVVDIDVTKNLGEERSGKIIFKYGTTVMDEVTVTQGEHPWIAVSPTSRNASHVGGTYSFDVACNADVAEWEAFSSDTTWLTINPANTEGVNGDTITFTVKPHDEGGARPGTITVRDKAGVAPDAVFTVTQPSEPVLEVDSDTRVSLTADEQPFTIELVASVSWTVTDKPSWVLDVSPSSGNTDTDITVTVARNKTEASREGTIWIKNAEYSLSAKVDVFQSAPPIEQRPLLSVYDTVITARTSVIKEMKTKVYQNTTQATAGKGATIPATLHYRAPVSKKYTMVMAYSGDWKGDYSSEGYGYIWGPEKTEKALKIEGEILDMSGMDTDGETTFMGPKGLHVPESGEYRISGTDAGEVLYFSGLAVKDTKVRRIASSAGFVYGENFFPVRCTLGSRCAHKPTVTIVEEVVTITGGSANVEQGIKHIKLTEKIATDELGEEIDFSRTPKIPTLYYPAAVLDEVEEDQWMLTPAHFFGTYVTRYNKAKSELSGKKGWTWESGDVQKNIIDTDKRINLP